MAGNKGTSKLIIVSVIALALMAPLTIKFVTGGPTSTVNYATEEVSPKITLNPPDEALSLGSHVTFTTTVPRDIPDPKIEILCYQENRYTFGTTGGLEDKFRLGGESSLWRTEYPNDPADCVVNLFHFENKDGKQMNKIITSTSFSVPGR